MCLSTSLILIQIGKTYEKLALIFNHKGKKYNQKNSNKLMRIIRIQGIIRIQEIIEYCFKLKHVKRQNVQFKEWLTDTFLLKCGEAN